MSSDQNPREPGHPLATSLSQAASVMATAMTEYMTRALQAAGYRVADGTVATLMKDQERDTTANGVAEAFTQYRDALGDLASVLPQIVQRASLAWQAEPGMRVLFRARPDRISVEVIAGGQKQVPFGPQRSEPEKKLFEAIRAFDGLMGNEPSFASVSLGTCEQSRAAASKVKMSTADERKAVRDLVHEHFSNPARGQLPTTLEKLKHEIRRNRETGLAAVRHDLGWLFKGAPGVAEMAYAFIDELDDVTGTRCLREILHERAVFDTYFDAALARPAKSNPDWVDLLTKAMHGIGHQLSERLAMVGKGSGNNREYWVFDHGIDRIFVIRHGLERKTVFDTTTGTWTAPVCELEVHGLREGIAYDVASPAPPRPTHHLPHRIHEARTGTAIWTVDRRRVQEVLDSLVDGKPGPAAPPPRMEPDVLMRAWDMGSERTPLALFAVDYRETDLGSYLELGLGCFVHPLWDPTAIGLYVLGTMPVSTDLSKKIGNAAWGYDKTTDEGALAVKYLPDESIWTLTDSTAKTKLEIRLPRGGARSSTGIPLLSYTPKFGQWHRAVFKRSGSGESLRVGGHGVAVTLTQSDGNPVLSLPTGTNLVAMLHRFGLLSIPGTTGTSPRAETQGRRAAYSVWTEHLTGEIGPACLVPVPPPDEDR